MCIYLYVYTCMYVVGIYEVKVTQLCLTLCDPRPHFHVLCPWNSPGKNTGDAGSNPGFGKIPWSGFPFPFSGDIPDPRIEPGSPTLHADSLSATRETLWVHIFLHKSTIDFCTTQIWTVQVHLYIHFFWSVNIVPHDPRLTESMDMEGRLLIICGFSTEQRVGDPNTCAKFKDRVCVCVCVCNITTHYIYTTWL